MSTARRTRAIALGVLALAAAVVVAFLLDAASTEEAQSTWEQETSWGDPELSADGRTLTVKVFVPPEECGHLDRLEHTTNGETIRVSAISTRSHLCAQGCPISGEDLPPYIEASIEFDEPISGLEVVEPRRVAEHCSGEPDHPTRLVLP